MLLLYHLAIALYSAVIRLASVFSEKASLMQKGREDSFGKLQAYAKQNNPRTLWFHCASLGEYEQARPLIELIRTHHPDISIALSFFSPSGYEIQKNNTEAALVFYLPSDTEANARLILDCLKPEKIFFVKYEFWLQILFTASQRNTPLYLISALFRPDQIFFRWYGGLFRKALACYTGIFVQEEKSQQLLSSIGVESAVSGDTRYDRVLKNKERARPNEVVKAFGGSRKILVVGSSWEQEEKILFDAYPTPPDFKIIIAPHAIERTVYCPPGYRCVKYSETDEGSVSEADILIIDNIGMLSTLYAMAHIAFVGGGFRGALHNILEAAVFGIPVLYGPDSPKQPEAADLQAAGGGFVVTDAAACKALITPLLQDASRYAIAAAASQSFIASRTGATRRIAESTGLI